MKLTELYIENFGGLSHFSLDFSEGLTCVMQPNGFGKTTIAEFIRAMFYGFPRKSRTLEKSRRQKYEPWSGGTFGGNLVFEHGEKRYRLERTFARNPKGDTFALIDLDTNKKTDCFTEEIGLQLFGIDADSFERSTYLPQIHTDDTLATTSIQAKLSDLVEDSADVGNFDRAVAALKASRSALIPYRGSGGSVAETAAEITALQLQLEALTAQERSLYEQLESATQQEQTAEKIRIRLEQIGQALDAASSQEADRLLRQQYAQLQQRYDRCAERLAQYRKKYPRGLPPEEELHTAQLAAERLTQVQAEVQPPDEAQLRTCRNLCAEYTRLQSELQNLQLRMGQLIQLHEQPRTAKRGSAIAAWILAAAACSGGAVLALLQQTMFAVAALTLGVAALLTGAAITWRQNRKIRVQQQKVKEKLADLQQQIDSMSRAAEKCSARITTFFEKCGLDVKPQQYDAALAQLEQETKNRRLLQAFLEKYALEQTADLFRQIYQDIRTVEAAKALQQELEAQLETMERNGGEILFAETSDAPDLRQLRAEAQNLRTALEDATSRCLLAQQNARSLQQQTAQIPQLRETLESRREKLQQQREQVDLLDATIAFLQQARDNLATAYMGTIRSRFGVYLSELEGNTGEEFLMDSDFQVQLQRLGQTRELAYFSAGKVDLVMLCMRFALVDALFRDQKMFVILDDPFVNLDDTHIRQARSFLQKLASRHQILYLTCHTSRMI